MPPRRRQSVRIDQADRLTLLDATMNTRLPRNVRDAAASRLDDLQRGTGRSGDDRLSRRARTMSAQSRTSGRRSGGLSGSS